MNEVECVCKEYDTIWVKWVGVDDKGRVKMSGKAALREEGGGGASAAPQRTPSGKDEVPPSEEEVVTFG